MAKLIITDTDNVRREFPLAQGLTIGRSTGNHIQISEEKASRTHCRIRTEGEKFYVNDLNSSNGTFVNGQQLSAQHELRNGDLITIGSTSILFDDEKPLPDGGQTLLLSPTQIATLDKNAPAAQPKTAEPKPSALPKTASVPPVAPRKPSQIRPREKRSSLANTIYQFSALLLVAVLGVVAILKRDALEDFVHGLTASKPPQGGNEAAPLPGPEPNQPAPVVSPPPMPGPKIPPGPTAFTTSSGTTAAPPEKTDKKEAEDLNKALAERDRALASNNFIHARAALNGFLAAHPNGLQAERARLELKDTAALIESALSSILKDASKAIEERRNRLATQLCTRILAADPGGTYSAQARQMLTDLDASTEARFKELNAKAQNEMKAGNLDQACETLDKALDELGGTKWGSAISDAQLQAVMAASLLKRLDTECRKRSSAGQPIKFSFAGGTNGSVLGTARLELKVQSEGATLTLILKKISPADFSKLLASAGLQNLHLELACLWLVLERKDAAQPEAERALQDPAQMVAATRLASLLPNLKNLHVYDFSKWQQQDDWTVLAGSWSTEGGRYVLGSNEGGDTLLKTEALGGAFPAGNARLSFDFELARPGTGYFFGFELGTEQKSFGGIFSAEGLQLHANLKESVSAKAAWSYAPGHVEHVELAVTGEKVAVSVNGKPAGQLAVPGLAEFSGTLSFHARETGCAIGKVVLRNAE